MEDFINFEEEGFVVLKNLITKDFCEECIDYLKSNPNCKKSNNLYSKFRGDAPVLKILENKKLKDTIVKILGGDYRILWFKVLNKKKWTGQDVEYHQELIYNRNLNIKEDESVQLFLSLDEHNLRNGCLNIIPKSHKKLEEHEKFMDRFCLGKYRVKEEILSNLVDKYGLFSCEFEPGDCLIFKDRIIHGSSSNSSEIDRHGVAVSFVKKEVSLSHSGAEFNFKERNEESIQYLEKLLRERKNKSNYTPSIYIKN